MKLHRIILVLMIAALALPVISTTALAQEVYTNRIWITSSREVGSQPGTSRPLMTSSNRQYPASRSCRDRPLFRIRIVCNCRCAVELR